MSFHRFPPKGVSGVVVISESHISTHTWPEYGYGALDFYTCGDTVDPEKGLFYAVEAFGASSSHITEITRGIDEQDKIYEYGFTQEQVPSGSWVVGYKVSNDELWNEYVKKGLIKAVSVEGLFDMSFSKHKTDEYLLNEVINIITQIK